MYLLQVILCVIFGSCKAEKNDEVSFKRIIQVGRVFAFTILRNSIEALCQEHKFSFDPNEQLYWNVILGPTTDQVT
jgi:hypothetical protein